MRLLRVPFAWIEENGGSKQVIQFLKDGKTLILPAVDKPEEIDACEEFVKGSERMIFDVNGELKEEFSSSATSWIPEEHSMTYDAIVIGVGGMGGAALYHLAKRGKRVLGLEQFNLDHDLGSSHGLTRIVRLAKDRLLFVTGGIDAGPREGDLVQGSLRSCELHNLAHEVLTSKELQIRFPAYRFPRELVAALQPDAGFVLSERAIVAHVIAAQAAGAEVHCREAVRRMGSNARTCRRAYGPGYIQGRETRYNGRAVGSQTHQAIGPKRIGGARATGVDMDSA